VTSFAAKAAMLRNRVEKNARALAPWAKRADVTAYRLFDRDIPELPLLVDWYDGRLHVAEVVPTDGMVGPDHASFVDALIEAAAEGARVPRERVFVKRRAPRKGGAAPAIEDDGAPGERFVVREHGMKLVVQLAGRLDTGLFLDHRETRRLVRGESAGKAVLNLFSYTGAFTVAAAVGGAARSVSVDLNRAYCAWAAENLALNGIDASAHAIVEADAFSYLEEARRAGARFDVVVLDPPTVSKSKRMAGDLDVQRDHVRLVQGAIAVLRAGGVLWFSNNYRGFRFDPRAAVGADVEDATARTIPRDFKDRRAHFAWRIVKR
jgi:23S rRNA (cytosine1962-C5)-methyltransferase